MVLKNLYAHLLRGRKTLTKYGEWAGESHLYHIGSVTLVTDSTTKKTATRFLPSHTATHTHLTAVTSPLSSLYTPQWSLARRMASASATPSSWQSPK